MASRGRTGEKAPLRCVWMTAGVVSFKLCDLDLDCDRCPFDHAMTGRPARASSPASDTQGPEAARHARLPRDLFLHDRHVWARVEQGGRVRCGIDDLAARLLEGAGCVTLPPPGRAVERGTPGFSVRHRGGETRLPSPVAGTVERVNRALFRRPALLHRDPYGSGWALLLRPRDLSADLPALHFGRGIARWLDREEERLRREWTLLLEKERPPVGATMADGSGPLAPLPAALGAPLLGILVNRFLDAGPAPSPGAPAAGGDLR